MKAQHGPLSNIYVLLSMLGMIIGLSLWSLTPEWGFLFLLMSILVFIATFISAVRSPLPTDHDIELAIHEKYHGRRYPDTDLHAGLVKKGHKKYIAKHKKHLVKWHLHTVDSEQDAGKQKKVVAKKKSVKKVAAKKVVKKPVAKILKKILPKKKVAVTKKKTVKVVKKTPAKKKIVKTTTKKKVIKKRR